MAALPCCCDGYLQLSEVSTATPVMPGRDLDRGLPEVLRVTSCCPRRCPRGDFAPYCLHRQINKNPAFAGLSSYSGGGIRTRDLRVMSPNQGSRWATWGTASSGCREIEIGWDRLESVGVLAPFLAPARAGACLTGEAVGLHVRSGASSCVEVGGCRGGHSQGLPPWATAATCAARIARPRLAST